MQKPNQFEVVRNILILTALVGLVLLSWLFGHILRYSIPALWHPPVQETDPQIKNGFEPEGIRREVVLTGIGVFISAGSAIPGEFAFESCFGSTYYTSLPAKCRSASGELVQVGGTETERLFIPPVR